MKKLLLALALSILLPTGTSAAQVVLETRSFDDRNYQSMSIQTANTWYQVGSVYSYVQRASTSSSYRIGVFDFDYLDTLKEVIAGIGSDAVVDSAKFYAFYTNFADSTMHNASKAMRVGRIGTKFTSSSTASDVFSAISWEAAADTSFYYSTANVWHEFSCTQLVQDILNGETCGGVALGYYDMTTPTSEDPRYYYGTSNSGTNDTRRPYMKIWISYTNKRPGWFSQMSETTVHTNTIRSDNATSVLADQLRIGYASTGPVEYVGLISFDNLDSLAGLTVNSAYLEIYEWTSYENTPYGAWEVIPITYNVGSNVNAATWNHANGTSGGWDGASGDFDSASPLPIGSVYPDTSYGTTANLAAVPRTRSTITLTAQDVQDYIDGNGVYGFAISRTTWASDNTPDATIGGNITYLYDDTQITAGDVMWIPRLYISFSHPSDGGSAGQLNSKNIGRKRGVFSP